MLKTITPLENFVTSPKVLINANYRENGVANFKHFTRYNRRLLNEILGQSGPPMHYCVKHFTKWPIGFSEIKKL